MTDMLKIRCAKCDKLVDHVYWSEDNWSHVVTIIARCHGETDKMCIDLSELSVNDIKQIEKQEGIAFAKDLIEFRK